MITQSSLKNIYKERTLLLLNHFENNMHVFKTIGYDWNHKKCSLEVIGRIPILSPD